MWFFFFFLIYYLPTNRQNHQEYIVRYSGPGSEVENLCAAERMLVHLAGTANSRLQILECMGALRGEKELCAMLERLEATDQSPVIFENPVGGNNGGAFRVFVGVIIIYYFCS